MDAHVFIDNSNIYGGAQRAAAQIEPAALWLAVRVYYRNFFRLIEGSDGIVTKVLAGSVPPGNDDLWQHAKNCGYNTDLLKRVEADTGNLVEQGVDELLHLKIANVLLDYLPPQKLVLCTGDGSMSSWGTSFLEQAQRAIKHGWSVDIWSWKEQFSGKFGKLKGSGLGSIETHELNGYYFRITFLQAGTYFIGGISVNVEGRVVANFP